ncbi:hypothetical protein KUTeg_009662 [Tegillarca granosa]|uniref:SURP motif domain-containing protein n=1 Tax=Tegillarca granosa TaxID=220873 RepID=A0ABQ9F4J4_TEGGR|nr:hypothetical protein KUTeg_009662 [Tegillarca granosa]
MYSFKLYRYIHIYTHFDIEQKTKILVLIVFCKLSNCRYDGRGHLYDLSQYDVSNVKAEHKVLSEEEKQIETLCDEERYLELHTDVAEKKMYEEEEWKRYYETLSEGYNAVGFSYDYQHQHDYDKQSASAIIEEKPFVVPEEIQVPAGMITPTTEKHHAIIEKTAKFIASHGIQMEIIIKTKQKDNSQFDFMHFDDEMNPYYKHLLQMIKSGRYKPKVEEKPPEEEEDHENEDHPHHHGYLHPSLMPKRVSPTPEVGITVPMPKISIHDTPYGQLIKSLKKTDEKHAEKTSKKDQKKTGEQHTEKGPPPPPPVPSYMSDSVYGPTRSGMPLPPGIEPVTLPSSNQPPPPGTDLAGPILPRYKHKSEEEEDDDDEHETSDRNIRPEGIVPPPPDIQPIIDRMAMYVAKNGEEFEIVVKSKRDTRFDFLHSWHTHFPYYNFKKNLELKEIQRLKKQTDLEKPKGVSFSIKNKVKDQDTVALEKRQVFDNESSEDEKDGDIDGYRLSRSDISGAATPVDGMSSTDYRNENKTATSDRKLAEEKLKDKLAVAAREKLAQASKEKQMKAERKRKVAMFVNMLKSSNQQAPGQSGDENKDDQDSGIPNSSGTPLGSRSQTPINWDESTKDSTNGDMYSRSSKRSRDRSRSTTPRQFRRSPSPLPFSRSRRSRSRSPRRRRRSPTPPSAYSRTRRELSRSPVRWGVPRPASPIRRRDRSRSPRYSRTRSRSPSIPNSRRRDRSRSPRSSRNKSPFSSTRKRSRSRSSSRSKSTKSDRKSSPSSSTSRSSKKSKKKKKSRSKSPSSRSKSSKKSDPSSPSEVVVINDDSPEIIPQADIQVAKEPLEEGEIDSRLSPAVEDSSLSSSRIPQLSDLQKTETEVMGGRNTPSNIEEYSNSSGKESKPPENQKNVSNYMLSRVRAIIKASRQAVLEEEGPLDDDL